MDPNIEQRVRDTIHKHVENHDIDYFKEIGFTNEDLDKINQVPDGVNDINLENYCSSNFLDSFKTIIDTRSGESMNLILDKMITRLDEEHGTWPINPNKHHFSSISDKKIIKDRVSKIIEEKFMEK